MNVKRVVPVAPTYKARERVNVAYELGVTFTPYVLDLSTARNKERIADSGDAIIVLNSYKTNETTDDAICDLFYFKDAPYPLEIAKGFQADLPFREIFISNTAQAGETIILLIIKGLSLYEFLSASGLGFDINPQPVQVEIVGNVHRGVKWEDRFSFTGMSPAYQANNGNKYSYELPYPMEKGVFQVQVAGGTGRVLVEFYVRLDSSFGGAIVPNYALLASQIVMRSGEGAIFNIPFRHDGVGIRFRDELSAPTISFDDYYVGYIERP